MMAASSRIADHVAKLRLPQTGFLNTTEHWVYWNALNSHQMHIIYILPSILLGQVQTSIFKIRLHLTESDHHVK